MLPGKGADVLRPYEGKGGRGASRGLGLRFGVERFGYYFAVGFSEEDFYFTFGFFKLFLTLGGKGYAFLKEFHRVVERKLRTLELADDFFEAREGALEIGLLGRIGFVGSRCVHVFFAGNSLRQGGEGKQEVGRSDIFPWSVLGFPSEKRKDQSVEKEERASTRVH
jgi:hypothetical protein